MKFPGISKVGNDIVGKYKASDIFSQSRLSWWLSGKESVCQCRRCGFTPGSGRFPEEGNDKSLQYPYLENPIDRRPWWATVHGVTKSQTEVSN